MNDLLFTLVVVIAGFVVANFCLARFDKGESMLLWVSLWAHVGSAIAQVLVTTYYFEGGGDMLSYHSYGAKIAHMMADDFFYIGGHVLKLIFQLDNQFPFATLGGGNPTGTLEGLTAVMCFLLNDSLYAACVLVSFVSFAGKLAIYQTLRDAMPVRYHRRMLVASMLVPSAVFWTSGVTKEAFAITGLGFMFYGLSRFVYEKGDGLVPLLGGALLVGLIKPYVLFPFVLAGGLWYYASRSMPKTGGLSIKPFYLALGVGGGFGALLLLGQLFPTFSIRNLGASAARLQALGTTSGSSYAMGDGTADSLTGQLAFAPFALFSALFRPMFFEVRNAVMLINAVETTIISVLLIQSIWTRKWAWMWATVLRSPIGMFCLAFTVLLGVGVGLGTTNLGTLSRYRVPMMPFYAALILWWSAPAVVVAATRRIDRQVARAGSRGLGLPVPNPPSALLSPQDLA